MRVRRGRRRLRRRGGGCGVARLPRSACRGGWESKWIQNEYALWKAKGGKSGLCDRKALAVCDGMRFALET